jgi:peptidyl-prolyl isomerase D
VVFGRVIRGVNTVRDMENQPRGNGDKPINECRIVDCGVITELEAPVLPADGDSFPDYPQDCDPPKKDGELLEAAKTIRQTGNSYFKEGNYTAALEKYGKSVRYAGTIIMTSVISDEVNAILAACHSNSAMCWLKLKKFNEAKKSADDCLRIEPQNVKALYRRGLALLGCGETEDAIENFRRIIALEPENADAAAQLAEAQERLKKEKEKIAAGYKKMFS